MGSATGWQPWAACKSKQSPSVVSKQGFLTHLGFQVPVLSSCPNFPQGWVLTRKPNKSFLLKVGFDLSVLSQKQQRKLEEHSVCVRCFRRDSQ